MSLSLSAFLYFICLSSTCCSPSGLFLVWLTYIWEFLLLFIFLIAVYEPMQTLHTKYQQKFLLMHAIFSVYNIILVVLYIFPSWFYQVSGVWDRIFNEEVLHFCSLLSGHIYALFFKRISCFYFLYCTRAKYLHCEEFLVMFSFLQDFKRDRLKRLRISF